MANWNDPQSTRAGGFGASPSLNGEVIGQAGTYDQGLRRHMLSIYNYMASGVLLTGIVALLFARSGMAAQVMGGPLAWLIMLAPIAIVMAMSFGANRFSTGTLQAMFWGYALLMGLSLSTIFLVYTGAIVATAFFAAAGAFAGMSLFAYTTKRDLSGLGAFMSMGVIGIIIATVINMIWPMPGLNKAIPYIGVIVFAGLTAWDTQRMKQEYHMLAGTEFVGKAVVLSALSLYLDFINMFLFLLRIFSNRD